jgi:hypothetical protein
MILVHAHAHLVHAHAHLVHAHAHRVHAHAHRVHVHAHLVMRKYGSWSMAHGMRHRSCWPPNCLWNDDGNEGAACMAGNATLPIAASGVKPKMPFT